MKNSFVVYNEVLQETAMLDDAQLGQLFRAMVRYNQDKEPDIVDPLVCVAFGFIKTTMDRDRAKYEETCAKRQEAGRKGGRPKKNQTAHSGDFLTENQMVSKKADNVPVNVPENENDNVREDVSVSVLDVLDCQDTQDTQDTQTKDSDTIEQDYQHALYHAEKQGYQFSAKQKKMLRQWLQRYPFEVVILAFDRSTYYQAKSVAYVYKVLAEWQDKGLRDEYAVKAYIAERDGEEIPLAI